MAVTMASAVPGPCDQRDATSTEATNSRGEGVEHSPGAPRSVQAHPKTPGSSEGNIHAEALCSLSSQGRTGSDPFETRLTTRPGWSRTGSYIRGSDKEPPVKFPVTAQTWQPPLGGIGGSDSSGRYDTLESRRTTTATPVGQHFRRYSVLSYRRASTAPEDAYAPGCLKVSLEDMESNGYKLPRPITHRSRRARPLTPTLGDKRLSLSHGPGSTVGNPATGLSRSKTVSFGAIAARGEDESRRASEPSTTIAQRNAYSTALQEQVQYYAATAKALERDRAIQEATIVRLEAEIEKLTLGGAGDVHDGIDGSKSGHPSVQPNRSELADLNSRIEDSFAQLDEFQRSHRLTGDADRARLETAVTFYEQLLQHLREDLMELKPLCMS